jgi:hypothetical protein
VESIPCKIIIKERNRQSFRVILFFINGNLLNKK